MADLRDALEAQFEAAEDGTLETPIEREIESNEDPIQAENRSQEDRQEASGQEDRDEKGRFKSKSQEASSQDYSNTQSNDVGQANAGDEESSQVEYSLQRPTTFKKEYVPIWEKMAAGKPLTPEESIKFAEYAGNIRESEYKKGVSTYKAEADNAKSLIEAISPFVGELQKQNIHPAAWINNLGRAHMVLSQAPMAQKIEMFQRLAADYGIQFNQAEGQVQYQQQDPYQLQLMQQLQAMNQEVSTIKGRYEQEENQRLMSEVNRVAQNVEQFPHFETVREDMAQLLERGLANDLETAYSKAVRLRDDVWQLEQDRLLKQATQQQSKKQQVQKAKATAVSPRSVTPNGMVATSDKNKDRKSLIESQFDSFTGNRF
jgi:Skp family chaperone for outer membrane proteins